MKSFGRLVENIGLLVEFYFTPSARFCNFADMQVFKNRSRATESTVYLILWVIAIGLYLLDIIRNRASMSAPLVDISVILAVVRTMLPFLILFLINNNLLIPKLMLRNRLAAYLAALVAVVAVMALYQYFDFMHAAAQRHHGVHPAPHPFFRPLLPLPLLLDFTYAILVVGCNLAVALMFQRFDDKLERESLMKASAESQLAYLKTQINPHFYMNMLNNIHGMIEIDPEKAQMMVIDMSQLMRYMLYESSRPRIPLSQEITFLRNYMNLMRQRFPADKVRVTDSFPADSDMHGVELPPLLFLVFVENAFKHGVSYREESFVAVSVEVSADAVRFSCMNSNHAGAADSGESTGIGLRNVRQRLELIYGNRATLDIQQSSAVYTVNLTIHAHVTENTDN